MYKGASDLWFNLLRPMYQIHVLQLFIIFNWMFCTDLTTLSMTFYLEGSTKMIK